MRTGCLCLLLFGSSAIKTIASEKDTSPVSSSSITATELFQRMHIQSQLHSNTAKGGYVYRIFNDTPEEKKQVEIREMRKALTEAKEIRIANEATLGRKVDEAALDADIEANIVELTARYSNNGWQTFAVKYVQEGDSYRIEQFNLPNDEPLHKLAEDLKSGIRKFEPTYLRTWNGTLFAELLRDEAKNMTVPAISYENRAVGVVKFTSYSREDAADPTILEKLATSGHHGMVHESQTVSGEFVYILKVGDPASTPIYLEITALPEKGYCVQSASTKVGGRLVAQDKFDGFVKTSAGFWLPTHIDREIYGTDKERPTFLHTKEELLAFELPETNIQLAKGVFDLSETDEFKSHRLSTHLLPQKSPYIERPSKPTIRTSWTVWLIVGNSALIALAIFWFSRNSIKQSSPKLR